jgi:hypothetical protein
MNKKHRSIKNEMLQLSDPALAYHHDADGIASGVLLTHALNIKYMHSPEIFGHVDHAYNITVDMVPVDPAYSGYVIDHHPGERHFSRDRLYKLIFMDKCATNIVLEVFWNEIPPEHRWKAAVGAVGDYDAENLPLKFWKACPELLRTARSMSAPRRSLSDDRIFPTRYPIYKLLSSPVNSLAKIGKPDMAFERLLACKTPMDLLRDTVFKLAGRELDVEVGKSYRESRDNAIDFGSIVYWEIDSGCAIEGELAAKTMDTSRQTCIVYNTQRRKGSIRGDLCQYIKALLPEINIGGHNIAMGFNIPPEDDIDIANLLVKRL